MQRILLLGDSIRISYQNRVKKILADRAEVFFPDENGRFARYTYYMLPDWLRLAPEWDIIHFNNGLWDTCERYPGEPFSPPKRYREDLTLLAAAIRAACKRPIYALTTPVRPEKPDQRKAWIDAANTIAIDVMDSLGIEILDLHAVIAADPERLISNDYIHLTACGIEAAAAAVAGIIAAGMPSSADDHATDALPLPLAKNPEHQNHEH